VGILLIVYNIYVGGFPEKIYMNGTRGIDTMHSLCELYSIMLRKISVFVVGKAAELRASHKIIHYIYFLIPYNIYTKIVYI
jgi:hypothetical protein